MRSEHCMDAPERIPKFGKRLLEPSGQASHTPHILNFGPTQIQSAPRVSVSTQACQLGSRRCASQNHACRRHMRHVSSGRERLRLPARAARRFHASGSAVRPRHRRWLGQRDRLPSRPLLGPGTPRAWQARAPAASPAIISCIAANRLGPWIVPGQRKHSFLPRILDLRESSVRKTYAKRKFPHEGSLTVARPLTLRESGSTV